MTPKTPLRPVTTSAVSTARHRRVKRGIVAGYLHSLSPRHRGGMRRTPHDGVWRPA